MANYLLIFDGIVMG